MTSERQKPREWWLTFGMRLEISGIPIESPSEQTVHVIEYIAYQNAMAHSAHSCAVARAAYEELDDWKSGKRDSMNLAMAKELAEAKAEIERGLAEARHGNAEWTKLFDEERARKLALQDEIERLKDKTICGYCDFDRSIQKQRDQWKEQAEKLAEKCQLTLNAFEKNWCIDWGEVIDALAEFEKFKESES